MSDSLDAAMDALEEAAVLYITALSPSKMGEMDCAIDAARAAVRKAKMEMGEECVVEELLYGKRIVSVQTLKPGDRVRVIRVEGGK